MSLSPGTRIGQYEITGAIGAGGMGEVYRATDTKLGREVAIKTLPSAMAADTDRLARFEREAKLLAALNHPNIAVIYGLEEQDAIRCIAMELIEGETLEERLKDGPLPVEDALRLALQIAEALEAAHGKSVVHRDLKPANVMITGEGLVKVLDFGLAKAFSEDPDQATLGHSPALSAAMTQQGVILGTAAYMSPEQASGQATDQRADIWAFGVLLFEMLSGLPLFTGESVPHILAAVLQSEPDWNRLPKNLHPRLKLLLERCLKKKARDRYHAIADARIDIEEVLNDPEGLQTYGDAQQHHTVRPVLPWAAASLTSGVAIAGLLAWGLRPIPELPSVSRFSYELPVDQAFRNPNFPMLAISPDGAQFVYNTTGGLYLRTMDELEARLIPGTEPSLNTMVFSPDGLSVAYRSVPRELRRIGISGGVPVGLGPLEEVLFGISWQPDGSILYAGFDGIYRVPGTGGAFEHVISVEDSGLYGAELLPDGDSVLFSVTDTLDWDASEIVVQSLATGERTVLIEGGNDARYLPTGHIVYALGSALFAVAFDADTLTVSGGPVPVVEGVFRSTSGQSGVAHYDVSDNGTLIYAGGGIIAQTRTFVWVDREGREEPISALPRNYVSPRLSPDGTKLAFNTRDQQLDIWTWDFARETLMRLTLDSTPDLFPLWSPDGQRIAYGSFRPDGSGTTLSWRAADGTGAAEQLAQSDGEIFPTSILPNSTAVLMQGDVTGADQNVDITVVQLDGGGTATPLLHSMFNERHPEVSPDGRWLAYTSDESGSDEVYVRPFPDINTGRWQVSTGGGTQPLWSRGGGELFYRNGEGDVVAVRVETDPSFEVGTPEALFEGEFYAMPQGGRSYDVSLDGESFLMMKDFRDTSATSRIIVVENWFEELKQLVPTE